MFDEIPPRPAPPSHRLTIVVFSIFFASFLAGLVLDWFLWSGPMSLTRKTITAGYIVGSVLSAVFLLTAESVTPESNQKRMWALVIAISIAQVVIDVRQ
jgi:hypothetical protein